MMRFKSLMARITVWYSGFMLLLALLFVGAIFLFFNQKTDDAVKESLTQTVDFVYSKIDGRKGIDMRELLLEDIDGQMIGIYDGRGGLMAGTEPEGYESNLSFSDGEVQTVIIDYKVYYIYDRRASGGLWVRGYTRSVTSDETVQLLKRVCIAVIPVLVCLMLVGGWILTKRALRPLKKMDREAALITDGTDLDRRIDVSNAPEEIQQLGNSLNEMLSRLEESFLREKRFSSDVSHELRTPLAVIMAQCELVQEDDMQQQEYQLAFNVVARQTEKLKALVEDLLQLGRMESGQIKAEFLPHDLSVLTENLIEEQRIIYKGQDTITEDIEQGVTARYDETLLERAIRNILNNAHQYGGAIIDVQLRTEDSFAVLTVRDHGNGVQEENLPKIWDRFYQENTSRSRYGSFGLGLPMVKEITAIHKGTITARNAEDGGMIFELRIPL